MVLWTAWWSWLTASELTEHTLWGTLSSSEPFVPVVKFAAAMWGARLHCKKKKWSQDVTLIPPIGLKSKDLEAFKFLYQEYDKDNKWQSENTGLSSFLKQEARQTAFWYIFKLWSWLHFIMEKKQCLFFKARAKKVYAIVSSLHPNCRGLYWCRLQ